MQALPLIILFIPLLIVGIEYIALRRFVLPLYKIGIPIYRKVLETRFSNWSAVDGKYESNYGIYLFDASNKRGYVVVRNRPLNRPLFSFVQGRGYLSIIGTITEVGNRIELKFKLSILPSMLLIGWTLIWLILPIYGAIKGSDFRILLVGVAGLAITFVILHVAQMILTGKFLLVHDEIIKILRIRVI